MSSYDASLQATIVNGATIKVVLDDLGQTARIFLNGIEKDPISVNQTFIDSVRNTLMLSTPSTKTSSASDLEKLLIVFGTKFCPPLVKTIDAMHTIVFNVIVSFDGGVKEYDCEFQRPEAPDKEQFALKYAAEVIQHVVPFLDGEELEMKNGRLLMYTECLFNIVEVEPRPPASHWEALANRIPKK